MRNFCQEILTRLINQHGHELTNDPNRLYAMLLDLCSQHTREVHVLSAVVKKGLVKELLRGRGKIPPGILMPKLANRLYDELGTDREIALWAVTAWYEALGLDKKSQKYLYNEKIFNDYRYKGDIGRGCSGKVYSAENSAGFKFAVKELNPNLAEELNTSKINSLISFYNSISYPEISHLIDFGVTESGSFGFVSELFDKTLSTELGKGSFSYERSCRHFKEILRIIELLSKKNISHNGLKPQNLYISDDTLKAGDIDILDLNLSKKSDMINGLHCLSYNPPERIINKNDKGINTDLWSASCIFYEMLCGKKAFSGKNTSEIIYYLNNKEPDLSIVPERFNGFFKKAFQKDKNKRHKDLNEFKTDFLSSHEKFDTEHFKFQNRNKYINPVGMEFVWIKSGKFMMGSPESEEDRYYDELLHEVELTRGFYMMTTPVTQRMYEKITGDNPSFFDEGFPDCPVECISWNDAQKFIIELNKKDSFLAYSLPTEAQWEYCCRAGTTTAYSWGDSSDCSKANFGNTWLEECKGINPGRTSPVKSYPPNPWGIYDMHGNVLEWCLDWYGNYKKEAVVNPSGSGSGLSRVIRGGWWYDLGRNCRSANRDSELPGYFLNSIGFRLVAF